VELRTVLHDVSLQVDIPDCWLWLLDPKKGFLVHGAYNIITSDGPHQVAAALCVIWSQEVPLKALLFAWR